MSRKKSESVLDVGTKKNKKKSTNVVKKTNLLKEMPGEEKYQGISPINRFNILFVDLQIIFTIVTIICVIWYLFNSKVWHVLQFVLGITMFIIGYNNKIIYNKPKFVWVYYSAENAPMQTKANSTIGPVMPRLVVISPN